MECIWQLIVEGGKGIGIIFGWRRFEGIEKSGCFSMGSICSSCGVIEQAFILLG